MPSAAHGSRRHFLVIEHAARMGFPSVAGTAAPLNKALSKRSSEEAEDVFEPQQLALRELGILFAAANWLLTARGNLGHTTGAFIRRAPALLVERLMIPMRVKKEIPRSWIEATNAVSII